VCVHGSFRGNEKSAVEPEKSVVISESAVSYMRKRDFETRVFIPSTLTHTSYSNGCNF